MTHAKQLQQNFSRAAQRYDQHALLQKRQVQRVFASAAQHFPDKATVLDIGCGTGFFAETAQAKDWRVIGLDYAFAMAQQAALRTRFALQGNALGLPLADASCDGVVSSLCMQWLDDKPAMLAEIRRVLKPGGVAVITTLGDRTLHELREAAAESELPLGILAMLGYPAYRAMARESGMQLIASQRTIEIEHYPSVEALFGSMRSIGAGNAGERRFVAPSRFSRLIQQYEALYGTARGIPASWEPILMVLRK